MGWLDGSTYVVLLIVAVLAPIVPLILLPVVFGVVLIGGRRRPVPPDPSIPLSLTAHLTQLSPDGPAARTQPDNHTYGTVRLDRSHFYWDPQDGDGWCTPIRSITVLDRAPEPYTLLLIDGSGTWRLAVSDRQLTQLSGHDPARSREAQRGAELRERLRMAGARTTSAP